MGLSELALLKWVHILAMAYWLGGEWGVFQTSYHIVNRDLPLAERRRHMETAYRIDILARSGIILLLPLGLHMGAIWTVSPYGGPWLWLIWTLALSWLGLCWAAFVHRESDRGLRLTRVDEALRFLLIPLLIGSALSSLLGHGPFKGEPGMLWFPAKILIYALMLVIGLKLRFIMREWTLLFRCLDQAPGDAVAEARLEHSIRIGRLLAYVYWAGIATVALIGAGKPF